MAIFVKQSKTSNYGKIFNERSYQTKIWRI